MEGLVRLVENAFKKKIMSSLNPVITELSLHPLVCLKPNSIRGLRYLVRSWFEAGRRQVPSRFEAGRIPAAS